MNADLIYNGRISRTEWTLSNHFTGEALNSSSFRFKGSKEVVLLYQSSNIATRETESGKTQRPTLPAKIKLSYIKFPIISAIDHSLVLMSVIGIAVAKIWGIIPIHPYILLWIAVSGVGMAIVIWTAAEEFGEKQK